MLRPGRIAMEEKFTKEAVDHVQAVGLKHFREGVELSQTSERVERMRKEQEARRKEFSEKALPIVEWFIEQHKPTVRFVNYTGEGRRDELAILVGCAACEFKSYPQAPINSETLRDYTTRKFTDHIAEAFGLPNPGDIPHECWKQIADRVRQLHVTAACAKGAPQ